MSLFSLLITHSNITRQNKGTSRFSINCNGSFFWSDDPTPELLHSPAIARRIELSPLTSLWLATRLRYSPFFTRTIELTLKLSQRSRETLLVRDSLTRVAKADQRRVFFITDNSSVSTKIPFTLFSQVISRRIYHLEKRTSGNDHKKNTNENVRPNPPPQGGRGSSYNASRARNGYSGSAISEVLDPAEGITKSLGPYYGRVLT